MNLTFFYVPGICIVINYPNLLYNNTKSDNI